MASIISGLFFDLDVGGRRGYEKKLFNRFRLDIRRFVSNNRGSIIGIHYLHSVLIAAPLIAFSSSVGAGIQLSSIVSVIDMVESRQYRH